jgi:hypothetical protein
VPSSHVAVIRAGSATAVAWAGVAMLGSVTSHPIALVLLYAATFASYAWACAAVLASRAPSLRWVLAFALAFRLLVLASPVSDDVNRYLWEGRVQSAGFDPYSLPPNAPELAELADGDPWHAGVNHPEWTAIYAPVTMLWHRAVASVAYHPLAMKLSFLGAEALLVALLIGLLRHRGLPAQRVLIYAWNPLATLAVAVEGHHEPIGAALLVAALWCADAGRHASGAAALAGAVMAKGFALATVPALLRFRSGRSMAAFAAMGILLILPFAGAGTDLWSSLLAFGGQLHNHDSLHALASLAIGRTWSLGLMAAIWIALAVFVLRRCPPDPLLRAAVLLAGMLLVLPTMHPWYVLSLLPLLCFFPWWGWLALSGTVVLTYLPHLEIAVTGRWVEWPALKVLEYAPLLAWLCWRGYIHLRRRRTGLADRHLARPTAP